ncbi:MAG: hypothetical protein M3198_12795 [Actinomycetota bacterium]|nr:hypothetical protein [Actinomycetota bacterium]
MGEARAISSGRSVRRRRAAGALMVATVASLLLFVEAPVYAQTTVWASLTANPTSGTAPLEVNFSTSGTDGAINTWTLDFGDGQSTGGNGMPPDSILHTYQEGRSSPYQAVLVVYGDRGASAKDDASVTVSKPEPSPSPEPTKTKEPPDEKDPNPGGGGGNGGGDGPKGGGGGGGPGKGGEGNTPPTAGPTPTPSVGPTPSPDPGKEKKRKRERRDDRRRRPGSEDTVAPEETSEPEETSDSEPPAASNGPPPSEDQRSEFVRSLADPSEVSLSFRTLAESILLAALLILLVGFPADMFNATLLAHYEEVTGWFSWGWLDRFRAWLSGLPSPVVLVSFAAAGALLYAQLSPDFGFNRGSLALLAGMFVSFLIVSLTYDVARALYIRRRFKVSSKIRAQVAGIVVGTILVIFSRIADFQPGYVYGVFTALVFRGSVDEKDDGRALGFASVWLGVVAVGSWFAQIPVSDMAAEAGAPLWVLALEAGLASLWVAGLGAIVFGLVPLRFFYGAAVRAWNRRVWLAIYATGMLFFALIVLHPDQALYGSSEEVSLMAVVSLFFAFSAFSLAFWAYFRYRHLWRRQKAGTT